MSAAATNVNRNDCVNTWDDNDAILSISAIVVASMFEVLLCCSSVTSRRKMTFTYKLLLYD